MLYYVVKSNNETLHSFKDDQKKQKTHYFVKLAKCQWILAFVFKLMFMFHIPYIVKMSGNKREITTENMTPRFDTVLKIIDYLLRHD